MRGSPGVHRFPGDVVFHFLSLKLQLLAYSLDVVDQGSLGHEIGVSSFREIFSGAFDCDEPSKEACSKLGADIQATELVFE
jgi:hypothetical protein